MSISKDFNSHFEVPHQTIENHKVERIAIFVHKNACYKLKEDININCGEFESLSIDISTAKSKNTDSMLSSDQFTMK